MKVGAKGGLTDLASGVGLCVWDRSCYGATKMDGDRLDTIARGLAASTRRGVLTVLTAGGLASLGVGSSPRAAAGCGRAGAPCRKNSDCCRGAACRNRRCQCKPAHADCAGDGRCINLLTSARHCGECDRGCSTDPDGSNTCFNGNCCRPNGTFCLCSPAGLACNAETCCQNGGDGVCLANHECP